MQVSYGTNGRSVQIPSNCPDFPPGYAIRPWRRVGPGPVRQRSAAWLLCLCERSAGVVGRLRATDRRRREWLSPITCR